MIDFDNDGDLDIVETNGMDVVFNSSVGDQFGSIPMRFWENDGTGVFTEIANSLGTMDARSGKGLLSLDFDRDGDLDIVVVNNRDTPVLYRNDSQTGNDWLQIELVGIASNIDGVGALIRIDPDATVTGDEQLRQLEAGSNYLGQSPTLAHFGLGDNVDSIDSITIQWPSGVEQTLADIGTNQLLTIRELSSLSPDFGGDANVRDDFDRWLGTSGSLNVPEPASTLCWLATTLVFWRGRERTSAIR